MCLTKQRPKKKLLRLKHTYRGAICRFCQDLGLWCMFPWKASYLFRWPQWFGRGNMMGQFREPYLRIKVSDGRRWRSLYEHFGRWQYQHWYVRLYPMTFLATASYSYIHVTRIYYITKTLVTGEILVKFTIWGAAEAKSRDILIIPTMSESQKVWQWLLWIVRQLYK